MNVTTNAIYDKSSCETTNRNEGSRHTEAFKFVCVSINSSICMTILGKILSQPNFLTPKGGIAPLSFICKK